MSNDLYNLEPVVKAEPINEPKIKPGQVFWIDARPPSRLRQLYWKIKSFFDREFCPATDDNNQHCNCWWDGDACCRCGAREMTEKEMRKQGMID